MYGRKIRSIAVLSVASLVAQPLIVSPRTQACPVPVVENVIPSTLSSVPAGVATNSVSAPPATLVPVTLVPLTPVPVTLIPATALSTAEIETQRGAIAEIMIKLGEDEDRARQMATELTAEDLAVLLANPKMMQKAGDLAVIVVAVLIVGGIVALALAADSAFITSN